MKSQTVFQEDEDFSQHLRAVDPLQLYRAAIHSMRVLYQKTPNLQRSFHRFYEMLRGEETWLNQSITTPIIKLQDLLNIG